MQEQMDPIEHPDRFSDYLRQRLEDHRMPVETGSWEEVDTRLARRTTIRKRVLTGGLLTAAIFAGLVWLIRPGDSPLPADPTDLSAISTPLPQSPVTPLPVEAEKPDISSPVLSSPSRVLAVTSQQKEPERIIGENVVEEPIVVKESEQQQQPQTTGSEEKQTTRRGEVTVPVDKNNNTRRTNGNNNARKSSAAKDRSSWLVAAGFGTGGSVSLPSLGVDSYDDFYAFPGGELGYNDGTGSTIPPPWTIDDIPGEYNFADITYHLPLSFGLTVRKNLSPRFAIESGLLYTYLHNSYRSNHTAFSKSEFHQHYLGIPVNGVVYLLNRIRWNIYFSAGIMAEKSLSAFYTNTLYEKNGGTSISKTRSRPVDGLQWSINSSIGISYRLLRHWSLYAEPRFSYFFDNNQPATIRTDHPTTLGIGGGIRYEF